MEMCGTIRYLLLAGMQYRYVLNQAHTLGLVSTNPAVLAGSQLVCWSQKKVTLGCRLLLLSVLSVGAQPCSKNHLSSN